jgi:hypothetical protein
MNDVEDDEVTRRLGNHYRETAADVAPATLRDEVHEMLSSMQQRRPGRGPLLAVAATAIAVAVLGSALLVGPRSASPSTSGGTAASSAPVARPSPSAIAATATGAADPRDVGHVPVLRGGAIGSAALSASDESPFLVGGELSVMLADCFVPKDFPATPLLDVCDSGLRIDGAGPVMGDAEAAGLAGLQGGVVLRVHARDPRAAECPDRYRPRCDRAIVIEQELWRRPPGSTAAIPAELSLLPHELGHGECARMAFDPERCVAIVEAAKRRESLAWPAISAVRLEPQRDGEISLGSVGIVTVVFGLVDAAERRAEIRCLMLRRTSLVCGPGTVPTQSVEPSVP